MYYLCIMCMNRTQELVLEHLNETRLLLPDSIINGVAPYNAKNAHFFRSFNYKPLVFLSLKEVLCKLLIIVFLISKTTQILLHCNCNIYNFQDFEKILLVSYFYKIPEEFSPDYSQLQYPKDVLKRDSFFFHKSFKIFAIIDILAMILNANIKQLKLFTDFYHYGWP